MPVTFVDSFFAPILDQEEGATLGYVIFLAPLLYLYTYPILHLAPIAHSGWLDLNKLLGLAFEASAKGAIWCFKAFISVSLAWCAEAIASNFLSWRYGMTIDMINAPID